MPFRGVRAGFQSRKLGTGNRDYNASCGSCKETGAVTAVTQMHGGIMGGCE